MNDDEQSHKPDVFISYSRDDLAFADQLDAALGLYGFNTTVDRHAISGGEDWKRTLGNLIRDADTIAFVLSPSSARSETCAWEVDEAYRLGKRIIPVLCRSLEGATIPAALSQLNYIFFYNEPKAPGSGFGAGLVNLVGVLNTDLNWLREHTRLLQRAMEWDTAGRHPNRLLSGADIESAKTWAAKRPKDAPAPTTLHLDFIKTSETEEIARADSQRKELQEIADAQKERGKALEAASQALKLATAEQRKRAKVRNIAFAAVSLIAVVAGLQWWRAENQRKEATAIRNSAMELILAIAEHYPAAFDNTTSARAIPIFTKGAEENDPRSMNDLGIAYAWGKGVAADGAKAREWFEKAAKAGLSVAMKNLGVLFEDNDLMPRDYAKAMEWYAKASESGNVVAMVNLGNMYEGGRGVAADYAVARSWYDKAAAKNSAGALVSIGGLYKEGRGVAQDYAIAREYYQQAAAKNNTEAMVELAGLYEAGLGVPKDLERARKWFEEAAIKGHLVAQYRLRTWTSQ